ncbi:MAG: hypothetical protein KIT31_06930 [Deltaproteobacteria bacterium]|nr:hypothetical protein [Deltaproteobacteria bacterium]
MRARLHLTAIAAIAAAAATRVSPADARPRVMPPFERLCVSTMAWPQIAACIQRHGGVGAQVDTWSADLRVVKLENAAVYLYLRDGAQWRMVSKLGDKGYELVGASQIRVAGHAATKIEMAHVVPMYGGVQPGWFRERVVLVCTPDHCEQRVVACTVMQRGRAVEAFHGTLRIAEDGTLDVAGDRSHTGVQCRNR